MKATFVPEWPGSSIGSVGLSVVAATVTVISRMEMMDGDQGVGEAFKLIDLGDFQYLMQ